MDNEISYNFLKSALDTKKPLQTFRLCNKMA